jgi:hypothetical protein
VRRRRFRRWSSLTDSGVYDTVGGSARALAGVGRSAGWPMRVAEHPFSHGAKEVYLDEAFAFRREHEARSSRLGHRCLTPADVPSSRRAR